MRKSKEWKIEQVKKTVKRKRKRERREKETRRERKRKRERRKLKMKNREKKNMRMRMRMMKKRKKKIKLAKRNEKWSVEPEAHTVKKESPLSAKSEWRTNAKEIH